VNRSFSPKAFIGSDQISMGYPVQATSEGRHCPRLWKGQSEKKTDIPSDQIMIEMFKSQPTVLILEEFQT
jgi:hypothetical protein